MRKPKITTAKSPVNSSKLEEQLGKALRKRREIEKHFQENHQKYWVILFIDVSESAAPIWEHGRKTAEEVFELYQNQVRAGLESQGASFIEPGGGPQIVCCFEEPSKALAAADSIRRSLIDWEFRPGINLSLKPAIGAHIGYIVYENGSIRQSNTNNLAKRIQSQAQAGQILISSSLFETLQDDPRFYLEFVRTEQLKNIPDPQDLYEVFIPETQKISTDLPIKFSPVFPADNPGKNVFHWILVCIDVCESTRKFWSYGDLQAGELIRQYQILCRETFKTYGCDYVYAGEGDQIIAGFERSHADHAAMAAIRILQGLFRRNINVPTQKQVRAAIGIHAGEVILQGEQIIPTKDLQVVKSIQSLATADEILLSLEVYQWLYSSIKDHAAVYKTLELPEIQENHELYTLKWFHIHTKPPNTRLPTLTGKRF